MRSRNKRHGIGICGGLGGFGGSTPHIRGRGTREAGASSHVHAACCPVRKQPSSCRSRCCCSGKDGRATSEQTAHSSGISGKGSPILNKTRDKSEIKHIQFRNEQNTTRTFHHYYLQQFWCLQNSNKYVLSTGGPNSIFMFGVAVRCITLHCVASHCRLRATHVNMVSYCTILSQR